MRTEPPKFYEEKIRIETPTKSSSNWAGAYLKPALVVYRNANHNEIQNPEFWINASKKMGLPVWSKRIHLNLQVQRSLSKIEFNLEQPVYLTMDGMLTTTVPKEASSKEEAILLLSKFLSFVVGMWNIGGFFFNGIRENDIFPVNFHDAHGFKQKGGEKDRFFNTVDTRDSWRRISPLEKIVDEHYRFDDYPFLLNPWEVERYFLQGCDVVDRIELEAGQILLALEATEKFTYRDWNGALLAAWAFIETLLTVYFESTIDLRNHRDMNVAGKINHLQTIEIISIEMEDLLHGYRKHRNKLIHDGVNVDKSAIDLILPTIALLSQQLYDVGIYTNRQGGTRPGGWITHLKWEADKN